IEDLFDVLRLRPAGADGKPVSVTWTRNCVKQLRHFLRWLNKAPEFEWRRPADLELGRIHIPHSPQELAAPGRPSHVQTYSPYELQMLYHHATPLQRLWMLLALNCGFGRAELASLDLSEVLLRRKHPHGREVGCPDTDQDSWVLRVRHKSRVYGEWKLWPET